MDTQQKATSGPVMASGLVHAALREADALEGERDGHDDDAGGTNEGGDGGQVHGGKDFGHEKTPKKLPSNRPGDGFRNTLKSSATDDADSDTHGITQRPEKDDETDTPAGNTENL